ncbi:toprim domain-containing protein [Salipiger pacificus]|nr:toprim domain-containing protein [Alloyangia pacifica]
MRTAREITLALGGSWQNGHGMACCPAHEDGRPSLSISDGSDGRLLLHCFAGCDFRAVLGALQAQGLAEGRPVEPDREAIERRAQEQQADRQRRERQAWAVWRETVPLHRTPGEVYLRSRGIDIVPPRSLRFHPGCWHGATARRLPAMVAGIGGCEHFAIHRTYLLPDGSGKADVEPNKVILGPCRGGVVELSASGSPLIVAEGIETALSAGLLRRTPARVWAALSTSGMRTLNLPQHPSTLVVAMDGDEPGREAGLALAKRAYEAGWDVRMWRAHDGMDFNDILLEQRQEAS